MASHNTDYVEFISHHVDSLEKELWPINRTIHENPELAMKEFIAHTTLTTFLKSQPGWIVTLEAYGMPTAFIAQYDSGKTGPVISFNAEYDALPGIGHACGHNLIAISSLSAALATKATMEKYDLPGKVFVFGTPAEEDIGGKINFIEAGAYDEHKIDVSLMSHPGNTNDVALVTTNALVSFMVEYFGKEAHAAGNPWEGINALDALIIAYTGVSVLRQQTMPGDIIQGYIINGGLAPNIIHAYASAEFCVRATKMDRLVELKKKVDRCFNAGAEATGATLKITNTTPFANHIPNHALGRSYRKANNRLGGSVAPEDVDLVNGQILASTDQGNVSHVVPSLHSGFQIQCEIGPHNPNFNLAAGTGESFKTALKTGKMLAATALDVLTQPGFLEEVKGEFSQSVNKANS